MANIRIPCLVAKHSKTRGTSWYWQPSATLARAGWEAVALGKDESAAFNAARQRNAEVERWKLGGERPDSIRARVEQGTLGHLIERYRREVIDGKRPNGKPILAGSTQRTYNTSLKRLEMWAAKQPLAYVTPARVKALRDAMMLPQARGGIGHHAAHQALKMGRTLFAYAISCDIVDRNPFNAFNLEAPPPRDIIWSVDGREAMVAAAHHAGHHSIALAIMLGFSIGQRQADIIKLRLSHYRPIPEHLMQPEHWRIHVRLAADGVPRGIRVQQNKTRAHVWVPIVGEVRTALETAIDRAIALGSTHILIDDTRCPPGGVALYSGRVADQSRFQRDFADIRAAAIAHAEKEGNSELAEEMERFEFRDLRRTCVVYLGELGMSAHQIASITGHDIDESQKILDTYMPRTTAAAAGVIALTAERESREAERRKQRGS